jgi:AraC-like DNA-binding protein
MKIEKEVITFLEGKSFRLFSPSLRDNFYWHYHPEIELTLVEATAGLRHVGQHFSSYMHSDLVLIGSNIPHLNFDYGLKTEYKQIVVQLRQNFLGNAMEQTPEFLLINELISRSAFGISFYGETKKEVATKLHEIVGLTEFDQLLALLHIFRILAASKEYNILNEQDTSVKLFLDDKIRMGAIYNYIHANYNETPDVNEVAASVHLSTSAFCRYFKKQTKITFTDFVNQYRISQAKTLLLQDITVSETCYLVGFSSLSYFSKLFKSQTGQNPTDFKKRYSID